MPSPAADRVACAPASQSQPVFPDEILEEIFLRLDAAEDLARASAACTTFQRVVSARSFLHRFRCLHPAPVLGFLKLHAPGRFHPAEPPHRSAPAARALAQSADFAVSFLGSGTLDCWKVCDARDGRLLLYFEVQVILRVCDPLHRRQVRLPPIPNDLVCPGFQFDAFLDPATDAEKERQDLSFRVICAANNQHNIVTFHFSSATGKWRGITFSTPVPLGLSLRVFRRYYAHGCFFWMTFNASFMLMLNMDDMKLSAVELPPGTHENPQQAIVEAGEGTIGLFTLSVDMLQLYCKSLQGTDWRHERIISLPKSNSYWKIHNAAEGYLLLQATPLDSSLYFVAAPRGSSLFPESQYFTLNLKTFLVERLCILNQYIQDAHLYASFLLPFSQPSI